MPNASVRIVSGTPPLQYSQKEIRLTDVIRHWLSTVPA